MLIFRLLFLLLIVSSCAVSAIAKSGKDIIRANEDLLNQLDSIIAKHDDLVNRKETRIKTMRRNLYNQKSLTDRFDLVSKIYDEYLVYDADSAIHYAEIGATLARRIDPDNNDMRADWTLKKAYAYTLLGLVDSAELCLKTVTSSSLSPNIRAHYYSTLEYSYSMRSIYVNDDKVMWRRTMDMANTYRDSLHHTPVNDNTQWLWIPIAIKIEEKNYNLSPNDVKKLKTAVDTATAPSRQNAINAYWLSCYYDMIDDDEMMIHYKTLAAIYDASIVNREIAAIQELATWLFDNGDLNRAYNYLMYSVNRANELHNRYRIVSLSSTLNTVRDAYRNEIEKRDRRLRTTVCTLAAVAFMLICAIVWSVVEYRRLHRTRESLSIVNRDLKQALSDRDNAIKALEQANTDLTDANNQKIGLLTYTFGMHNKYITTLDDFRRKLLRYFKARRFDEMGALLIDSEIIKDQYSTFYECFDRTVLEIFPDFIDEYNASGPEDDHVDADTIAREGVLNTRLRIYALRRLGVEKSADIARMLNISIRTVYNNRSHGN